MNAIQVLFGWPGIVAFVCLATVAAWLCFPRLMLVAFALSLPNAYYLFGGNNWVHWMALYIPLSLFVSAVWLRRGQVLWPRMLLVPVYAFYIWLANSIG
jgi:hypothetical protein